MKVEIDANGRKVAVECGEIGSSIREVGQQALDLWRQTADQRTIAAGFRLDGQLAKVGGVNGLRPGADL